MYFRVSANFHIDIHANMTKLITPDTLLDNAQEAFDWLTSIKVNLNETDIASLAHQYELYGSKDHMKRAFIIMPDM